MTHNNPLLKKYYEMFPEKKEPPKLPRIEDYEGEETIADLIKAENAKNGFELKPEFLEQLEKRHIQSHKSIIINIKCNRYYKGIINQMF